MKTKIFSMLCATSLLIGSCKLKFEDRINPEVRKDPVYKLLTGNDNIDGKVWRASVNPRELGVGSKDVYTANIFDFPEGVSVNTEAWLNGTLQNRFTFVGLGNKFIPKNQTITANWAYANRYFGMNRIQYDDAVVTDPSLKEAKFKLKKENNGIGTGYTLEITDGSYIGRLDKRYTYQIMSITEDTLRLRHLFNDDTYADPSLDALAWYSTYVRD